MWNKSFLSRFKIAEQKFIIQSITNFNLMKVLSSHNRKKFFLIDHSQCFVDTFSQDNIHSIYGKMYEWFLKSNFTLFWSYSILIIQNFVDNQIFHFWLYIQKRQQKNNSCREIPKKLWRRKLFLPFSLSKNQYFVEVFCLPIEFSFFWNNFLFVKGPQAK